jgi:hypothetical protein
MRSTAPAAPGWTGTPPPAASAISHTPAECASAAPTPHAAAHIRHHDVDAGVDLRDIQIAARHADPRTTMRYDRARQNLDRHPNCMLAAFMVSGTDEPGRYDLAE